MLRVCRFVGAVALAAAAVAPAIGRAAPPTDDPAEVDPEAALDDALSAWANGEWTEVRRVLEPLVADGASLGTAERDETALRYLAEATLLDVTLGPLDAKRMATTYVSRLLDTDPAWEPPPNIHDKVLEDLVKSVRADRERDAQARCDVERATCEADLSKRNNEYEDLEQQYLRLSLDYEAQDVEYVEYELANRLIAFVPGGVGHFTNNRIALGASFLAGEVVFGVTALTFTIRRNFVHNCTRTAGFSPGSLECNPAPGVSQDQVLIERNLEQVFAGVFFGTLVVDVVLAQILFQDVREVRTRTVPRSELEKIRQERGRGRRDKNDNNGSEGAQGEQADPTTAPTDPPAPAGPGAPNAKVHPLPVPFMLRGGAGAAVSIEF